MPRRKATRAGTKRAKPKLKDENSEDALSALEREAKKKGYLEDCDVYVSKMEDDFEAELKNIQAQIDKTFAVLRLKQPPNVKHMTVEDYILSLIEQEEEEERDTFDTDSQMALSNEEPTPVQLNSQPTPSKTRKSLVLSKYKSKRTLKSINEQGAKASTVKKKTRGTSKSQAVTFNADQASAAQSSFITPALYRNAAALGWNTPLITPKFDPRLPITPAQRRNAKPGEIAISLAGSPLNIDNNKSSLMVNKKGKTLQIQVPDEFENILDNFDIPDNVDLENGPQDNVQKMMSMFAMIMKKNESDTG